MENHPRSSYWNTDHARDVYGGFAAEQLSAGIFSAYEAMAQDVMASDKEQAESLRRMLYSEAPLGVLLLTDFDDPQNRRGVVLGKVDIQTGALLPGSELDTGVTVGVHDITPDVSESSYFDESTARLLGGQYLAQELHGLPLQ